MTIADRAWCEVSLDAIEHNISQFKRIATNSKIMAVVKADAYGFGAVEVSKAVLGTDVCMLGVATADEAVSLRENHIEKPILILGHTPPQYAQQLVQLDITQTIYCLDTASIISKAAKKLGKTAKVHIKIDTGMNRLGFLLRDDTIKRILEISNLPNIEIEGLFTHFSCADEQDESFTNLQFERFMEFSAELEKAGLHIPVKHVCNSSAAMRFPNMHLDMIRVGISLYGFYPSELKYDLSLKPAMMFKTKVALIKEIGSGEKISYGGKFVTTKKSKVATLPVGYADGYSRLLSGKAKVIINGQFAPVVGTICMDQCIIDTTHVNNISIGDEVVLFGRQGKLENSVETLAKIEGTINYEILCLIGKRVPRYYIRKDKIVKILNYLV
ncbi:MAG: alanine racemase [Firmicutes bacterium]|nr:alanine racemase [Bacillota bacterium]